jgi:demethylmenaquinone methyltransferase/2-methoxy-6-polyprenyl-1,4-benzoquinol methylase
VLDVGCGTGDLAVMASRCLGPQGEVVGLDFSGAMLRMAAAKAERCPRAGAAPLRWVQAGAEALPLQAAPFDAVVSGFVLRNLYAHIEQILQGVLRSLKPGGHLRFLDLTEPRHPLLRALFRGYLLGPTGLYGALLFGRHYPILYLPDSARRFWKAAEFAAALTRAGFVDIRTHSFLFGTVTLYHAVRPNTPELR